MKRGEIWIVAGGPDYTGKPRPAVIVQSDRFDATNSITVVGFTTNPLDAPLTRPAVEPDATNGLGVSCRLMADKITTVPKTKLGRRIGSLAIADMLRLDRAMLVFLGIAGAA